MHRTKKEVPSYQAIKMFLEWEYLWKSTSEMTEMVCTCMTHNSFHHLNFLLWPTREHWRAVVLSKNQETDSIPAKHQNASGSLQIHSLPAANKRMKLYIFIVAKPHDFFEKRASEDAVMKKVKIIPANRFLTFQKFHYCL